MTAKEEPMREGPQDPGGYGSGGGFATNLDVMQQAQVNVQAKHDDMVAEVNKLMSFLETVHWTGPARAAFDQAKLNWHDTHVQLRGSLQSIVDGLGTSTGQFSQADTDSVTTLKSVVPQ
jgi:WXG100 family type VII secretion target